MPESSSRPLAISAADAAILDLPLQHRHDVRLLPASLVAEARTVEVVWSTGAVVRRSDPWTGKPYDEVLSLDPGHVDLSRLESGAPLLDSHAAHRLAGIIGVVERAWIESGAAGPEGRAVIRFSSRAEVAPVWEDVKSGIIRHVSVGYRVRTYRVEEDADPPVWRAVDWQPVELSLVAVPADPGAGLRSDDPTNACRLLRRTDPPCTETRAMTETITRDAPAADTATTEDQETETVTTATDDTATDDDIIETEAPETRAAPPGVVVAPTSAMRSALEAERRRAAPDTTP